MSWDWAYDPVTNLIGVFFEGIVAGAILLYLADDLMMRLSRRTRRRRKLRATRRRS